MQRRIIFMILAISANSYAEMVKEINVTRSINLESVSIVSIPVTDRNRLLVSEEIWRSPSGIACSVTADLLSMDKVTGSFECVSPEGYRAQIEFNCAKNISQESGSYLYFGLTDKKENVGNFYVWCE